MGARAGLLAIAAATALGALGRLMLGTPFPPEALAVGFYEALPGGLIAPLILLLKGSAKPLALAFGILLYLAFGSILGMGFQALYQRLPSRVPWAKGLAYAPLPWLLTVLLLGQSTGWRHWTVGGYRVSVFSPVLDASFLLLTYGLYGIILGFAYREAP